MRTRWLPVLVALSCSAMACKKKAADAPPPPVTPPPVVVDAAPPPPPVDAPAEAPPVTPPLAAGAIGVQVTDLTLPTATLAGLPAIKRDGSQVVVASLAEDSGRGYLDLTVQVLDGAGALVKQFPLADPEATAAAEPADAAAPSAAWTSLEDQTRAKVKEVNDLLATGDWEPLAASPTLAAPDDDAPQSVELAGVTYQLDALKQKLTLRRGTKVVGTHALTKVYKVPAKAGSDNPDGCGPEQPYLSAVYASEAAGKAVIAIGFAPGGHNCGASGAVYAVVPVAK
ncbi:MAG: hypothetical protein R3B06_26315 [Kofleriaceae bacterium]